MDWLKDPAWQQGLAILLVVAGAFLTYRGASGTDRLGAMAMSGVVVFAIGIALPLISQLLSARREISGKSEDV